MVLLSLKLSRGIGTARDAMKLQTGLKHRLSGKAALKLHRDFVFMPEEKEGSARP